MILEIDAGNTNIKWRLMCSGDGAEVKVQEGKIKAEQSNLASFESLVKQLIDLPFANIRRVKVSSVRGVKFEEMFAALFLSKWQLKSEFAKVEKQCCGILNSYKTISNMGVDRWLAMIAAFKDAKGACCVVDCGSAITLDLVDVSGKHLGGYIVPGFSLMKEALAGKSAALNIDFALQHCISPGTDTEEAIVNGSLNMVLGLIEGINARYQNYSWYITGGDAELIAPHISFENKIVTDLVLDGLAVSLV